MAIVDHKSLTKVATFDRCWDLRQLKIKIKIRIFYVSLYVNFCSCWPLSRCYFKVQFYVKCFNVWVFQFVLNSIINKKCYNWVRIVKEILSYNQFSLISKQKQFYFYVKREKRMKQIRNWMEYKTMEEHFCFPSPSKCHKSVAEGIMVGRTIVVPVFLVRSLKTFFV